MKNEINTEANLDAVRAKFNAARFAERGFRDAIQALDLAEAVCVAVVGYRDTLPKDFTIHAAKVRALCAEAARDLRRHANRRAQKDRVIASDLPWHNAEYNAALAAGYDAALAAANAECTAACAPHLTHCRAVRAACSTAACATRLKAACEAACEAACSPHHAVRPAKHAAARLKYDADIDL